MVVATRIVLSLLAVLGVIQAGLYSWLHGQSHSSSYAYAGSAIIAFLVFAVGWMVGGLIGKALQRLSKRVERAVQTRSAGELTMAALGLLLGLLVSALLYFPVHTLPYIGTWLLLPLFMILGYTFAAVAAKKHRGILRLVGGHAVEPGGDGAGAEFTTLVDTSAIIDGRIADIADSGFLFGILEVPRFVLDEVQRLADSSDSLRRTRGRRGLEILARMRKTGTTPVLVIDEDVPGTPEVDSKLVALAKRNGRAVLTNDLNLNRIADLQGVRVLNVNSLANAVKPALLPGEDLRVRVIQPGKDAGQGVGYLDDGTMVVVEGGAKAIDTELDVTVTRVLQTVAGRMVFAHPRQA
jgi:uncharacterized protein YacL